MQLYSSMPKSVLAQMTVDRVLPASAMPQALVELVGQRVPDPDGEPETSMSSPEEELERERVAVRPEGRAGAATGLPHA